MAKPSSTSTVPTVQLIPWDPQSSPHIQRLVEQRHQCGWNADKVEAIWRDAHLHGSICIFWIVIPSDNPRHEELLDQHAAKYPNDVNPILDTATSIRSLPRTPSNLSFRPVGHITLATSNDDISPDLGLPIPTENTYWIKTFYVSYALQSGGIGRAAMDCIEKMATSKPLNARHLMLDTLLKEHQMCEEIAMAYHGAVPKTSNQEWYARRGYSLIGTLQNHYDSADRQGKTWYLTAVVMRKDLD